MSQMEAIRRKLAVMTMRVRRSRPSTCRSKKSEMHAAEGLLQLEAESAARNGRINAAQHDELEFFRRPA